MKLYHGTTAENFACIMESGVDAPSYWGDLAEAKLYAGEDGVILWVETEDLAAEPQVNGLLLARLEEDAEVPEDWEGSDQTWQDSLAHLGSVRFDERIWRENLLVYLDLREVAPQPK